MDWPVTVNILRDGTLNGVLYGGGPGVSVLVTAQGAANSVLTANAGAPVFSSTPRLDRLGLGMSASATIPLSITGGNGPTTLQVTSQAITTGSTVMNDNIMDTTANPGDSAAVRAVARQQGAGSSSIIGCECHALRTAGASTNGTWAVVANVHSEVIGNTTTMNVGIYIDSSHSAWLSGTPVRNDTAVLILGEDGWNHGILYYDTNGSTVLFDVTQTGRIYMSASSGINTTSPTSSNGSVGKIFEVATAANTFAALVLSAQPTSASGRGGIIEVRHSGSVTGDARLGQIVFARLTDVTGGKISAQIDFYTTADGTIANKFSITTTGIAHLGTTLAFFSTGGVVQQTSGANLTNNVTSGGSNDTIADFTSLTVYASDAAAIRNDIYQLARKLKQINDGLRSYGLFT